MDFGDIGDGITAFGRIGRADEEPGDPRGVRILHADGRVSECALIRDPEPDPDGCTRWIAEPPPGIAIGPGDTMSADYLPGRTVISLPAEWP